MSALQGHGTEMATDRDNRRLGQLEAGLIRRKTWRTRTSSRRLLNSTTADCGVHGLILLPAPSLSCRRPIFLCGHHPADAPQRIQQSTRPDHGHITRCRHHVFCDAGLPQSLAVPVHSRLQTFAYFLLAHVADERNNEKTGHNSTNTRNTPNTN